MANGKLAVPAPPRRVRRHGLLAQMEVVEQALDDRWENGIEWQPATMCMTDDPHLQSIDCLWPATSNKTSDPQPAWLESDPWFTWRAMECSHLSEVPNVKEQARLSLVTREPYDVERAFSDGIADSANPGFKINSGHLADVATTTILTATPLPVLQGFGLLMQEMADAGLEVIHVPVILMPWLWGNTMVVRQGAHLETPDGGFEIVPGHGYSGSAPDGTIVPEVAWVYGTGPIRIFRSEILEFFYDSQGRLGLDTEPQKRFALAERVYAFQSDGCSKVAIPISIA